MPSDECTCITVYVPDLPDIQVCCPSPTVVHVFHTIMMLYSLRGSASVSLGLLVQNVLQTILKSGLHVVLRVKICGNVPLVPWTKAQLRATISPVPLYIQTSIPSSWSCVCAARSFNLKRQEERANIVHLINVLAFAHKSLIWLPCSSKEFLSNICNYLTGSGICIYGCESSLMLDSKTSCSSHIMRLPTLALA